MFTRKDYLDKNCNHREYYSQFVTEYIKSIVASKFGLEKLQKAYRQDKNLNTISLDQWDHLTHRLPRSVAASLKEHGDYLTLAGGVCILKEAAKQLVTE